MYLAENIDKWDNTQGPVIWVWCLSFCACAEMLLAYLTMMLCLKDCIYNCLEIWSCHSKNTQCCSFPGLPLYLEFSASWNLFWKNAYLFGMPKGMPFECYFCLDPYHSCSGFFFEKCFSKRHCILQYSGITQVSGTQIFAPFLPHSLLHAPEGHQEA